MLKKRQAYCSTPETSYTKPACSHQQILLWGIWHIRWVYGQFINNSLRAVNDTDWWYVRKYKAWTEKAGQRPLQRVTSHDTLAKCSQVWLASVDTTPYWQSAQVTPTNKNSIKAGLALQHVNQPAWHFHHASSITPVPTSRFITISFL